MPAIEQLISEALDKREADLRALVSDAVDAELQRLISELVGLEIEQRQNGSEAVSMGDDFHHPNEAEPPSTKQCSGCSRHLPLSRFLRHRSRCRDCRTAQSRAYRQRRSEREHDASDDEEPHPVRRTQQRGAQLIGSLQQQHEHERREQIATARANGVEYVERDGRTFTLLHLPAELEVGRRRDTSPPVKARAPPVLVDVFR